MSAGLELATGRNALDQGHQPGPCDSPAVENRKACHSWKGYFASG